MTDSPRLFIAYFRVSTDKQGRSGLGMEAQRAAVQLHTRRSGGVILASFEEVETGKHSDRPELQKALKLCRQKKAVLVIAKLDRLSRNSAFINNLLESDVDFVACDMPTANKLTIRIMAAIAEHEREAISQRTREALQAAKARGVKLGRPDADINEIRRHWSDHAKRARDRARPTAEQLRQQGRTLTQIADELNQRGLKTCRNGHWYASTVRQLLNNADKAAV